MKLPPFSNRFGIALVLVLLTGTVLAQTAQKPAAKVFEPVEGQPGKDVVWVPTPADMVERMLDLAQVTPQDFVIDLGSGDGRNVIAAAKRGARALGVEYNLDMVELSRRNAAQAGVADRATFVQGDMFEADISQATVLALFLLPDNLQRLTPKFYDLKPGTRIVVNTFGITGWQHEQEYRAEGNCYSWCTAMLYLVPAKVAGTWQLGKQSLRLEQKFETVTGRLGAGSGNAAVSNGRLRGDWIGFTIGKTRYEGRVDGDRMQGFIHGGGAWSAKRN